MPADWQQWMPFDIDSFWGSSAVQAMDSDAKIGYLALITSQWQSPDCTISSDEFDLAENSRLGGERWALHGKQILRNFDVLANGRLRNLVCFDKWQKAKKVYDARSAGGKRKLTSNTLEGDIEDSSKTLEGDLQDTSKRATTGTRTETKTKEQKQKPSRASAASGDGMKHSSDPRHVAFKGEIAKYWDSKNAGVDMPWGPAEGMQLGMFLREAPHITVEQFTGFLRGRFKSDVNHGERPSQWLKWITSYAKPVDRFGKPMEGGASGQNRTRNFGGKGQGIIAAVGSAIADLADHPTGHPGDVPSGSSGPGDAEVLRAVPVYLPPEGSIGGD